MTASSKNKIGAWKLTDIKNFDLLCLDALTIGAPVGESLWLTPIPPSPYSNVNAARAILHTHPIYRWLRRHCKSTLDAFETNLPSAPALAHPLAEFRFLRFLMRQMTLCRAVAARPTHSGRCSTKSSTIRAIKLLERHIDRVRMSLSNAADGQMLEALLSEAKTALQNEKLQPGRKHPRRLVKIFAIQLRQDFGFVEPKILEEFSAFAGIVLKKRDAQRYCKEARGSASAAPSQAQTPS